jgi:hypothetical protein
MTADDKPNPGPDLKLDPRVNPYRDDIAAAHLKGKVKAAAFVKGETRRVRIPHIAMMTKPDRGALQGSELLHGEGFIVYDERDGWAWGQGAHDGYVGYVAAKALGPVLPAPTHWVTAARSLVFPDSKGEYPAARGFSLRSLIAIEGEDGDYTRLAGGGWMFGKHLAPLHETRQDFLETAKLLLGTPYLWGGRGGLGIDCSGLIQIACATAGIPCPRDSDQQREALGDEVEIPDDPATLAVGDVFFFPGHVGFYLGDGEFLHASSFNMMVSVHPLTDVLKRVRDRHGKDIIKVRRVKVA